MNSTILDSDIDGLRRLYSGKVRDIYELDNQYLLIVTSDRISAFDVVLPTGIPGKGKVLTEISNFWFKRTEGIVANHLAGLPLQSAIPDELQFRQYAPQAVIVKKLKPLPIEAIVRGYLIGSGWKDYQREGSVCGVTLPSNLKIADKLPQAIFTPSSKADVGDHDINISFDEAVNKIGHDLTVKIKDISLKIYQQAAEYALDRGIIIADTKFEFGLDDHDNLVLMDEVLTPDSSRFWPLETYQPGISPPSYDKQFVRDYLDTLDWDKTAPGPVLPEDIVNKTAAKYQQAYRLLVGDDIPM